MNQTQKQLVKMLSSAVRKEQVTFNLDESIDWEALIEEAKEHKVSGLAYSAVKNNIGQLNIDDALLNEWKRDVIFSSMHQSKHVKQVSELLQVFNDHEIPVIILKGMVLRNLFPNPDLRTMSDVDVLVHEEDLGRIEDMLTAMNFTKVEDPQEKHDVYYKPGGIKIEVHWSLTEDGMFKGGKAYEEGIWDRTREVEVLGVKTLTLGYNDFIFHLIIHMASHVAYHGFGVRYLVDLVVMIEQQGQFIDWQEVIRLIDLCQIRKFSAVIFRCCEDLFGLKLPKEVAQLATVDSNYLTLFEDEVMNSGVHGYRESGEVLSRQISYNNQKQLSPLQKMMNLFFPAIDEMSDKYHYAKKNKFLAPIAWIHHLFVGLFHPTYSFKDKVKLMTSGYQTVKKRADMIEWLELE